MLAVVMALTPADFYKSMTTHADHTVWQVRIPANVTDDSGDRDRCWCCAM